MSDRSEIGQRVTVTGATGLVGPSLVSALRERGAQVTVLTRDPKRARAKLGAVDAVGWEPLREPAPAAALADRDAVVHLAGAPIAQRWSERTKRAIRDSRTIGTQNLIEGLRRAHQSELGKPPQVLVSSSAIGYYGSHGEEPLDEDAPPGSDFLAQVCVAWEAAAAEARELGMRVTSLRTGVVLDREGGALAKMLPPFRLGVGGPVAGGYQYISWIHPEDLRAMMLTALADGALGRADQRDRARAAAESRVLEAARPGARTARAPARAGLGAAPAVWGNGRDRHQRRPRDARQGARARLRVRVSPPGGRAARCAHTLAGTRSDHATGSFCVSMITRQGRLLSR